MAHNQDQLEKIRHSMAHVMANAVLQIFPQAKIAIGPVIENGFYYDFDLPRNLRPEDLLEIEKRMKTIIEAQHDFICQEISREKALDFFKDQPFKIELIHDLPENEVITTYTQNDFTDLCRGPHIENTKQLRSNAFKLLSIAGAYWRGDEKRPMLQRIYGTAWQNSKDLREYLKQLEEIKKRDHRVLGKQLDLFSIQEETGAGLIYWHPKGARLRHTIEDFWKKAHFKNGYELIYSPHIGQSWLWKTSGHLDFYAENMYSAMKIDEQDYYIKPMNCPFHVMVYKSAMHSYRDLPLRWAELGTVYRYERSGVLHGLLRVRGFTQDDAHIICTPRQIGDEIRHTLRFSKYMWNSFGFDKISLYLATKPEKSVGQEKDWQIATEALKDAVKAEGMDYTLDEGGGAFYGPKIDFKITDAIGREWQVSTIQFDFNLPERFDMSFVDHDGEEKRPFMVHRALLGSLERFAGLLIEHYKGAFPVWLAPVQIMVIPVIPEFNDYAEEVAEKLFQLDFRVHKDLKNSKMNAKIRNAQNEKIPYMLILGEKERESKTVSLRLRTGEQKNLLPMADFVKFLTDKVAQKELI